MSDRTDQEPTDADRAKVLRLAKLFDLRTFIGSLFVIFGVVVSLEGATASAEEIAKASDINISLWSGLAMLAVGLGFLAWMLAQPPVLPATDTSMERPDSTR
jgi:hypothetical protein